MRAAIGAGELTIDSGKRVRARKPSPNTVWTAGKETTFIKTLAESCNVKLAAKTAGLNPQRVYERRTRDATFRARWDQAIAVGYAQLEMMMLERALHGIEKPVKMASGEIRIMREFSDRVGLALLRMHRETAAAAEQETSEEDTSEAVARITQRLDRLRERAAQAQIQAQAEDAEPEG